jgi:hypothetical protein
VHSRSRAASHRYRRSCGNARGWALTEGAGRWSCRLRAGAAHADGTAGAGQRRAGPGGSAATCAEEPAWKTQHEQDGGAPDGSGGSGSAARGADARWWRPAGPTGAEVVAAAHGAGLWCRGCASGDCGRRSRRPRHTAQAGARPGRREVRRRKVEVGLLCTGITVFLLRI